MRSTTSGLWILCILVATAIGGCTGTQNRPPHLASEQIAAPLKLCKLATPPADLLARPDFLLFAVSVTDAAGNPVTSLKPSDFEAHAGGHTLPIEYFHEEPEGAPTSILIVMDLSGLMALDLVPHVSRIEAVQRSLPSAISRLNQCDEIAILVFGGSESADERLGQTPNPAPYPAPAATPIRLLQPFTTDHQLALMSLPNRTTTGLSPLYDAMQQGLNILQSSHYRNRAMIVITDGVDDTSAVKTEDLIAQIKQSGVPVHVVELGEPNARAYPPPSGLVIPIPFASKTGNTAAGNAASKTPCQKFKCVDTATLAKLTAPNDGQLLIVPHPKYDARVTLKDELNSIVAALNHGYTIGVVVPAGSPRPEIAIASRHQVKVRDHLISASQ